MAKTSAARKATFSCWNRIASSTAVIEIATVARRKTITSCRSASGRPRSVVARSWLEAEAAEMVRPATTARMVAKATPDSTPKNGCPPSAAARCSTAMLPPPSTPLPSGAWKAGSPMTKAMAPGPTKAKSSAKTPPMIQTATTTDFRAAASSGTVKKRISRCGSPRMPSDWPSAKDSDENRSIWNPPASKTRTPRGCSSATRS